MYQYNVEVVETDPCGVLEPTLDGEEGKETLGREEMSSSLSSSFAGSSPLSRILHTARGGAGGIEHTNAMREGMNTLQLRLYFIRRRAVRTCTHVPQHFRVRSSPLEDELFLSFYDGENIVARSHHRILVGGPHRSQGCCWVEMHFSDPANLCFRRGKAGAVSHLGSTTHPRPSRLFSTSSLLPSQDHHRTMPEVLRVGGRLTGMCRVRVMWEVYPEDTTSFFQLPTDFQISPMRSSTRKSENEEGAEGVGAQSEEDSFSFTSVNSDPSFLSLDDEVEPALALVPAPAPAPANPSSLVVSEEVKAKEITPIMNGRGATFSCSPSFHFFTYFAQSTTRLLPLPSVPPPLVSSLPPPLSKPDKEHGGERETNTSWNASPRVGEKGEEEGHTRPSSPATADGTGSSSPPGVTTARACEEVITTISPSSTAVPYLPPPPVWFSSSMKGTYSAGQDRPPTTTPAPPVLHIGDASRFVHLHSTPSPEEIERYRQAYGVATTVVKDDPNAVPLPPLPSASVLAFYRWKAQYGDENRSQEGSSIEKGEHSSSVGVSFRKSALFMEMKEKNFKRMKGS